MTQFIISEDGYNQLDQTKGVIEMMYSLSLRTEGQLAINSDALSETLAMLKDQLDNVLRHCQQNPVSC